MTPAVVTEAAARRHSRREPGGPRPAAEGQLVKPESEAIHG